MADGATVTFSNRFSNALDRNDALKMPNSGENLSISNGGKLLSLDARSALSKFDTVWLNVKNLRQQNYQLKILPSNFPVNTYKILLFDKLNQVTTNISEADTTNYDFTVTSEPASFQPNRFYLVLTRKNSRSLHTGGNNPLILSAKNTNEATISLEETSKIETYPNPSTSQFNTLLLTNDKEIVTLRVVNLQGKLIKNLKLFPNQRISWGEDLQKGIYFLETIEGKRKKSVKLVKL